MTRNPICAAMAKDYLDITVIPNSRPASPPEATSHRKQSVEFVR